MARGGCPNYQTGVWGGAKKNRGYVGSPPRVGLVVVIRGIRSVLSMLRRTALFVTIPRKKTVPADQSAAVFPPYANGEPKKTSTHPPTPPHPPNTPNQKIKNWSDTGEEVRLIAPPSPPSPPFLLMISMGVSGGSLWVFLYLFVC